MAKGSKQSKLAKLIEQAGASLDAGDPFAADAAVTEGIAVAESIRDWSALASLCPLIARVRGEKLRLAIDTGKLRMPADFDAETMKIEQGCYLIAPPRVGADGRAIRERADAERIPVFIIVREPTTRTGLWPVVMIGPATVRVRIKPPAGDKVTIEWMRAAADSLGKEAIDQAMSDERPEVRLALLLERLGTLHFHQGLIDAIAQTCEDLASATAA